MTTRYTRPALCAAFAALVIAAAPAAQAAPKCPTRISGGIHEIKCGKSWRIDGRFHGKPGASYSTPLAPPRETHLPIPHGNNVGAAREAWNARKAPPSTIGRAAARGYLTPSIPGMAAQMLLWPLTAESK